MSRDPALGTFLIESNELLQGMEALLLKCEQGTADPDSINDLFRAAHTIKGSAGLFGLDGIVAFTHVVESILDQVRIQGTAVTAELAAMLLECADHIQKLVDEVERDEAESDPALRRLGDDIVRRLATLAPLAANVVAPAAVVAIPAAGSTLVAAAPDGGIREQTQGLCVLADSWHISVRFGTEVLKNGMDPLAFIRYLTTFGSITGLQLIDDALPPAESFDPEACYLGFEIGLKTDATKAKIESAFEFVRDDCTLRILPPRALLADYVALIRDLPEADIRLGEMLVKCGTLTPHELATALKTQADREEKEGKPGPLGELLIESKVVQPAVVEAALRQQSEARATKDSKSAESRSIRVDGDKLDRLIDLIGELIIAGAATGSQAREAGLVRLNESTLHLARIVEEVRDQALKLRIVQIGPTFTRFQRVVRDVARETGKDIALEISGSETELDKTLVERIADPLTHLVRNAIDHGIEMPDVRRAGGKAACGVVRLNAYHDAGSVIIEISDDGAGLKRDRILSKAIERGLVTKDQSLSDTEIYALIFEPGFSTAEQVTNLSGRGVGMDVVKSNVTALRGTVEIDSQPGQGARVRLRLPLTLAIIDGFLVRVDRSRFVIALDLIEECVDLSAVEGSEAATAGHMNLRGSVLPLIRLRELFDLGVSTARRQNVVVVRTAGKRVGIVVDELLGELQAVIKPLSRLFQQLQGISGSTILGDGNVGLILDVPGLIERRQGSGTKGRAVPVNSGGKAS